MPDPNSNQIISSQTLAEDLLPKTLAQRIQLLRQIRQLSQEQLAKQANVKLQLVEDIEAGLELSMHTIHRRKLAKILRVSPSLIQAVEKEPDCTQPLSNLPEAAPLDEPPTKPLRIAELFDIMRGIQSPILDHGHACPDCGQPIWLKPYYREDLEGLMWMRLKIHCNQCLFQTEHEQALAQ